MKALIVVKLGVGDFLSVLLTVAYLLIGVGTGMLAYQAYQETAIAILAGFFWPFGLGWMLFDHTLCLSLVKATFGFLLK